MRKHQNTEDDSSIFRGGVPYAPDRARLDIAFPSLRPGDRISYDDIGEVIKSRWPSDRFWGVVDSWRNHLERDRDLHVACDPGTALLVLTAEQATDHHLSRYKSHGRGIGRSARSLMRVDRNQIQDEATKHRLDHARFITARTAAVYLADRKELAKEWSAPASLPKPRLVEPKEMA